MAMIFYAIQIIDLMSLTLVFIILSIGIGYMLYDTFRRARSSDSRPTTSANARLKVNYTNLQREKKETIKSMQNSQLSEQHSQRISENIQILKKTHSIYLLENISENHGNLLMCLIQAVGKQRCIPYSSTEGAVALLRQLSCGLHLQSNLCVYPKIKQYLNNIWLVGEDSEQKALREFSSATQMLLGLYKIAQQENNTK